MASIIIFFFPESETRFNDGKEYSMVDYYDCTVLASIRRSLDHFASRAGVRAIPRGPSTKAKAREERDR